MERLSLEVPAMFGDHHVIEVRRLLATIPGVEKVYASAAWQRVEVEFDPAQTNADIIRRALQARGYETEADHLPPVSPRTRTMTEFAAGAGAVEQFMEHVPAWSSGAGPCPGFEVRQPGAVHPADH